VGGYRELGEWPGVGYVAILGDMTIWFVRLGDKPLPVRGEAMGTQGAEDFPIGRSRLSLGGWVECGERQDHEVNNHWQVGG